MENNYIQMWFTEDEPLWIEDNELSEFVKRILHAAKVAEKISAKRGQGGYKLWAKSDEGNAILLDIAVTLPA